MRFFTGAARVSCLTLALALSAPAFAGEQPAPPTAPPAQTPVEESQPDEDQEAEQGDIVVTAPSVPIVASNPPDEVISPQEIATYGARNIAELLTNLGPRVRGNSARGGGGFPIVLINGRRVSGFNEFRNLPPDAIARFEVYPEEVALSYGYSLGQRVVNLILRDGFTATTLNLEHGFTTDPGRSLHEREITHARVAGRSRISLSGQHNRNTALTEAERDIIGTAFPDIRTLIGESDTLVADGTISSSFGGPAGGSLNLRAQRSILNTGIGRDSTDLDRVLNGRSVTDTLHAGIAADTVVSRWRLSLTANADQTLGRSRTDLNAGGLLTSRSRTRSGDASFVASGGLFRLPAGLVRATASLGWAGVELTGESDRNGIVTPTDLGRRTFSESLSLDLPIADRDAEVLPFLGNLSANVTQTFRQVSDFGDLSGTVIGFAWSPVRILNISGNFTLDEAAPGIAALGAPLITTPFQPVYDFTRGETVFVDVTTGGNPALLAERRRDFRIGATLTPIPDTDLRFSASYSRVRSRDVTASLPLLTPEIEAAFPGRVVRDASGRIVSVDQRSVTFDTIRQSQLRFGFNYSESFGRPPQTAAGPGGGQAGGAPGGGRPGAGPGGGRGGRGGMGFGFGGPGGGMAGGRWSIGLYDTVRFEDTVLIRPGLPVLDLLNGDSTDFNGGSPRHLIELEGGVFYRGMGARLSAAYRTGTEVNGGSAGTLDFSPLTTVNLRLFADLDSVPGLTTSLPVLKGTRVRVAVDNLFDDRINVRDANGIVPTRYQPGYLDPAGRVVSFELSKRF